MSFRSFRKPKKTVALVRKRWESDDDDDDDKDKDRDRDRDEDKDGFSATTAKECPLASQPKTVKGNSHALRALPLSSTTSLPATTTSHKARHAMFSFNDSEEVDDSQTHAFKIKKANPQTALAASSSQPAASASLSKNTSGLLEDSNRLAKHISYTPEILADLKRQQAALPRPMADADADTGETPPSSSWVTKVPNAKEIHAARLLREKRRVAASTLQDVAPSYISINESTVSRRYGESRILTEDQEIDGEEAFDDNKGDTIAFGTKTAQQVKDMSKREIQDDLNLAQAQDCDDDEIQQWELQQIVKGRGMELDIVGMGQALRKPPMSNDIHQGMFPDIVPIPSVPDIIAALDKDIACLTEVSNEHIAQLNSSLADMDASEQAITRMNSALKQSSERYDFFQRLSNFIVDLDEFLDAKMIVLESLERDMYSWRVLEAKNEKKAMLTKLLNLYSVFSGVSQLKDSMDVDDKADRIDSAPSRSLEEIITEHKHLFDDAKKQYRSISPIKDRFQAWKWEYPKDYNQAYGALSLAGVFELYVRYEHFGWNPFKTSVHFEDSVWHQELSSFGVSDEHTMDPNEPEAALLKKIAEKTIVPQLIAIIDTFDPFSADQTRLLTSMTSQLLDYIDKSSSVFKRLMDALVLTFKSALDTAADYACLPSQFVNVSDRQSAVVAKASWFGAHLQLILNFISFERYIGTERTLSIAISVGLDRVLLRALDGSLFFEDDLQLYEMVQSIINPQWIPANAVCTPPLLQELERVLIVNVCRPLSTAVTSGQAGDPTKTSALVQLAISVCLGIKSLDQASRLGKLLKKIKQ
ncbi:hypothetical protein BSLG_001191 [Batrachochytrium salamandrivorans]|nr:hypothetical protein BSLG_001191 [Batrachochytrium salamandrivorans]